MWDLKMGNYVCGTGSSQVFSFLKHSGMAITDQKENKMEIYSNASPSGLTETIPVSAILPEKKFMQLLYNLNEDQYWNDHCYVQFLYELNDHWIVAIRWDFEVWILILLDKNNWMNITHLLPGQTFASSEFCIVTWGDVLAVISSTTVYLLEKETWIVQSVIHFETWEQFNILEPRAWLLSNGTCVVLETDSLLVIRLETKQYHHLPISSYNFDFTPLSNDTIAFTNDCTLNIINPFTGIKQVYDLETICQCHSVEIKGCLRDDSLVMKIARKPDDEPDTAGWDRYIIEIIVLKYEVGTDICYQVLKSYKGKFDLEVSILKMPDATERIVVASQNCIELYK